MRVSVFGVGYVGCVTAACLANEGHQVIGVDVDPFKVRTINEGRSPFFEPGLDQLIREMVFSNKLRATADHADAVCNSDVALICVGTPANTAGSTRLDYLKHVFKNVAQSLRDTRRYYVVALRSTVLPTAFEQELIPLLEELSFKSVGTDIGFVYNPEFLREGIALKDFQDPPWTIIGSSDSKAANVVAGLYQGLPAPIVHTDAKTAALVKYFSNAFHALKVVFGNEVGTLCRELGVDGSEVMKIFCDDPKLNISARYLKPGFAFGGSCLPKDVKALVSEIGRRGLKLPVLESILPSNEAHLRRCIEKVANTGRRKVGLVGLSFKENTDDLRESPAVELAERLIGKGFDIRIYEPSIAPGKLHGSNLSFIERSIPHIWKLLVSGLEELMRHADVVVVMQQLKREEDLLHFRGMRPDQICIDLARALSHAGIGAGYQAMDFPVAEAELSACVA
jgi:GDP-mannose 6-dehydrogenase